MVTCNDCRNLGYCSLYDQTTKASDIGGDLCKLMQKSETVTPVKAAKVPQSVEQIDISDWRRDSKGQLFKLSQWRVVGETGKPYHVSLDSRGSICCNCRGFNYYGHCYHSKAVKDAWQKFVFSLNGHDQADILPASETGYHDP